jgi:hypothetical protein
VLAQPFNYPLAVGIRCAEIRRFTHLISIL